MKSFGVPAVVGINHFISDTDAEIAAVIEYAKAQGSEAFLCKHWAQGSKGIEALARRVVELADGGTAKFAPIYPEEMGLFQKIETIAKKIYRAGSVSADKSVRDQLKTWEDMGYGNLPVCMAKTQYSFTTDPNLRGAPTGPRRAGPRGAAVRRRRFRRRHLRRDHDHAGPAEGALGGVHPLQRRRARSKVCSEARNLRSSAR